MGNQVRNNLPHLLICGKQFCCVRRTEAQGRVRRGKAKVSNLFVEGFKVGEVCCAAKRPGVPEDLLDSLQPGSAEAHMIDRHLRRVVEEGRGKDLRFCSDRLGALGFNGLLVLAGRQPVLPGYPFGPLARLEAEMDKAEEANARHGVLIEQFSRIVRAEGVLHLLD